MLAVRLHAGTLQAIKDTAQLTGTTPSAVARDCLAATFDQIRQNVALSLKLRAGIAHPGRGKEGQP